METEHPSSKDPRHKIEWDLYLKLIYELAEKIKDSGIQYRYVYGIPRGGMIPAVILSHVLKIEQISLIPALLPGSEEKILIVDDLADTGETLKYYAQWYREYDIAVIYCKPWSQVKPTYYVEETELWIEFPYEVFYYGQQKLF